MTNSWGVPDLSRGLKPRQHLDPIARTEVRAYLRNNGGRLEQFYLGLSEGAEEVSFFLHEEDGQLFGVGV
jgi:hypothetical protein